MFWALKSLVQAFDFFPCYLVRSSQNTLGFFPFLCPADVSMSASKLEKNIANLERRMREEFRLELERALRPCLERLARLESETKLQGDLGNLKSETDKTPQVKKMLGDLVAPKPDDDSEMEEAGTVPDAVELHISPRGEKDHDEDAMEPVAFLETTWNLVLVLGHAGVGWIDVVIAWLLLVASAGMQITFCWILTTSFFLESLLMKGKLKPLAPGVAVWRMIIHTLIWHRQVSRHVFARMMAR